MSDPRQGWWGGWWQVAKPYFWIAAIGMALQAAILLGYVFYLIGKVRGDT